ncbi:DUF2180 family protein [Amycolatopsis sp. PS_44_ISF1]|uniref:DUF2180 family protein n=1 Tax=Amycolatopsis sp. PS_44_ISF1 TaxID=2974917 RepID=UPI0028DF6A35|nr:DUF2180 family protein [Amycolatopsis sp. PS_44_ISF1]MDT8912330.1 DUF2180 family protein [Amycolatopsis sp. PS_44_ISF1]
MNCFECAGRGETRPSVAVCTTCGAGACLDCVRPTTRDIRHAVGFSSAELAITTTRELHCTPCHSAISAHQGALADLGG